MKTGFTLIELLVVVLIIGILSAVALPQYQKAVLKSRYVQLMVSMKPVYEAWQVYYMTHGHYTNQWEELDVDLPGTLDASGITIIKGDYRCSLYYSRTGVDDSIACVYHIPEKGHIQYRLYPSGSRQCLASFAWDAANEVCKSLGGVLSSHNTGNSTNYYILPS